MKSLSCCPAGSSRTVVDWVNVTLGVSPVDILPESVSFTLPLSRATVLTVGAPPVTVPPIVKSPGTTPPIVSILADAVIKISLAAPDSTTAEENDGATGKLSTEVPSSVAVTCVPENPVKFS